MTDESVLKYVRAYRTSEDFAESARTLTDAMRRLTATVEQLRFTIHVDLGPLYMLRYGSTVTVKLPRKLKKIATKVRDRRPTTAAEGRRLGKALALRPRA